MTHFVNACSTPSNCARWPCARARPTSRPSRGWPGTTGAAPTQLSADEVQAVPAAPAARAQARAREHQPVRLRVSLPLRHRAGPGRPDLPDPAGPGAAAAARDPLARRNRAAVRRRAARESRTYLMLAYGTGLRLSELCALQVGRHRQRRRPALHPRARRQGGEGPLRSAGRRRPRDAAALVALRQAPHWLFAMPSDASRPLPPMNPQRWYRAACAHAGITKRGGIHGLRHCYATHLLEAGVDLYSLSQWLGHNHVTTTSSYLHLARPDVPDGARRDPLELLDALPTTTVH